MEPLLLTGDELPPRPPPAVLTRGERVFLRYEGDNLWRERYLAAEACSPLWVVMCSTPAWLPALAAVADPDPDE
eukprot:6886821-Lingulodinium_polyedra.AAC.1